MNKELYQTLIKMKPYAFNLANLNNSYQNDESEIRRYQECIDQYTVSDGKTIAIMFFAGLVINGIMTQYLINIPVLGMILELFRVIIAVAGGYFVGKWIVNKYQQSKQDKIDILEGKIEICKEEMEQFNKERQEIYIEFREKFKNFPKKYIDCAVIIKMMEYVKMERAHTIAECINLYEEELHRLKVEEQNKLILESQYRQEEQLKSMQYYDTF